MYYNPYAFFDVDCLEMSPKGRTFVCHPQVDSISEDLFEVYSIISLLAAPLVFSIDVNRNVPDENKKRDFLTVPVSKSEKGWDNTATDWLKFYIKTEAIDDKEKVLIFNNNENVVDCIKIINAYDWIVFGNGIEHKVDHVITSLLGIAKTVKYVPELIIPGEKETQDQLDSYCKKWEEQGAIPMPYDEVIELARHHRY